MKGHAESLLNKLALKVLDKLSLNQEGSMLSKLNFTPIIWLNDQYSIFTIKPLHLFHLGILKILKECVVFFFHRKMKLTIHLQRSITKNSFLAKTVYFMNVIICYVRTRTSSL